MRRTAERRLSTEPALARRGDPLLHRLPAADRRAATPSMRFALQASGRRRRGARRRRARAWTGGVLPQTDEQRLLGAFGGALRRRRIMTRAWRRCSAMATRRARRAALTWAPAATGGRSSRRGSRCRPARPTRPRRLAALDPSARARSRPAHRPGELAAQHRPERRGARSCSPAAPRLDRPPANPARCHRDAADAWRAAPPTTATGRPPTTSPPGRRPLSRPAPTSADRPYGERDDYTSLTWLAGTGGLVPARPARRRGAPVRALRPRRALAADPGQGLLLGRRAPPPPPASAPQANAWLEQAAASPDQFYGQLALERLGRTPPPPPAPPPVDRRRARRLRPPAAGRGDPLSRHDRPARRPDPVHPRARRARCENDRERAIAAEFGRQIGRLDLGVWAAREARNHGRDLLRARPPSPRCRSRPPMRTTGRSPTASSARKARSSGPRSARPARAA